MLFWYNPNSPSEQNSLILGIENFSKYWLTNLFSVGLIYKLVNLEAYHLSYSEVQTKIKIQTSPEFEAAFKVYPQLPKKRLLYLRELIIQTAQEIQGVVKLDLNLKWSEPAFRSNIGSTLRIDWKSKNPEQYALYFQCSSRLIETFRLLYEPKLRFEGNRAIILNLDQETPIHELKECFKACLRYHEIKHLKFLGIA